MITDKEQILSLIKKTVHDIDPSATVIVYGSYARGEEHADSDIDVLILVDSTKEKLSWEEQLTYIAPVSSVEWSIHLPICPVVYSKQGWANHRVTPYYENVNREGVVL